MQQDASQMSEGSTIVADQAQHDDVRWRCAWRLEKFWTPDEVKLQIASADVLARLADEQMLDILRERGVDPYEVIDGEGNLLMYGGASCQWQTLIGNGTTTADQTLTYFNNARAAIGVGDSSTAAAATQTDLQAATNKMRKAMDATYPVHTDGVVVGAASISFRSTFATTDANWAWQEWGVFNTTTAATGRMLNRKVESLGTKTSSATWQFTVTLTLA